MKPKLEEGNHLEPLAPYLQINARYTWNKLYEALEDGPPKDLVPSAKQVN